MRSRLAVLACITAALALAAPAPAQAQAERDCFWQGGNRTTNIAYPDLGARYWVGSFPLPPGAELLVKGRYAHARYLSFNVYDAAAQPTDAIADADILPDPGSANPFLAGARRDGGARSYTVRVVSGVPPAERAPNTVYLNAAGQASQGGVLMYRVYVPDKGRDSTGDAALPEISMRLPDGQVLEQPLVCEARESAGGPAIDELHANTDGPGTAPDNPSAQDPLRWEAFFNYAQAFTYPLGATPAGEGRAVVPRDKLGGFLSNVDNAYTFALASRGKGPVLAVQGKAPTTPTTLAGEQVMGDGQVRYWSLCENEFASQRVIDCLFDEQVGLAQERRFTIVMSTPSARPRNATSECGVNWISWGAQPDGFLILRHMLPSVVFAQAIQRVAEPGSEEKVIGEYLPVGRHTTKAAFEARGCAQAAAPGLGSLTARRCLARRSPVGRLGVGRVRLGYTRRQLLRRVAPQPVRRGRLAQRWCAKGSRGRVSAIFPGRTRGARARLVMSTAPGHRMRGVHRGSKIATALRRFPRARRIAARLYRAGTRSRRVFGVRAGRVRSVGVADRRLLSSRRLLARHLRRAAP